MIFACAGSEATTDVSAGVSERCDVLESDQPADIEGTDLTRPEQPQTPSNVSVVEHQIHHLIGVFSDVYEGPAAGSAELAQPGRIFCPTVTTRLSSGQPRLRTSQNTNRLLCFGSALTAFRMCDLMNRAAVKGGQQVCTSNPKHMLHNGMRGKHPLCAFSLAGS